MQVALLIHWPQQFFCSSSPSSDLCPLGIPRQFFCRLPLNDGTTNEAAVEGNQRVMCGSSSTHPPKQITEDRSLSASPTVTVSVFRVTQPRYFKDGKYKFHHASLQQLFSSTVVFSFKEIGWTSSALKLFNERPFLKAQGQTRVRPNIGCRMRNSR